MFYDISNCIDAVTADNTEVQITIQNGAGLLALNQVKLSGGTKENTGNTPATRSLARSGNTTELDSNIFLPLTEDDLIVVEKTLTSEDSVDGIVKNGVVIPLTEEEVEIPEDNTTPDDNNTNDGADTEESGKEEFSLFSLIEMLIAFIEKILYNAFGADSMA